MEITSKSVDKLIEKICYKRRHYQENSEHIELPSEVPKLLVALKAKNIQLET